MTRLTLFLLYIFSVLLLLSGAASFLPPNKWWPIAMLGNFFPVFYAFVFILTILLIFKKKGQVLLGASALLITLPGVLRILPVRLSGGVADKGLKVMTWNVGLMNYDAPDKETAIRKNQVIFDAIQTSNADIVCLQEFFTAVIPDSTYNFIDRIRAMGYPYHYFSRDNPKFEKKFFFGNILFSKFPVTDSSRYPFGSEPSASLIRAGIIIGTDTVDVITGHYQNISYEKDDNKISVSVGKLSQVKQGFSDQVTQARVTRDVYRASKRKIIFCADLNTISTSYLYRKVKHELNDAWLHGGFGLGATYQSSIPGIRIDHIFYSPQFTCTGAETLVTSSSDHNAVLATFNLK